MSDDGDDVDPTSPQPEGYYGWSRDSPWCYVSDELAQTFILEPTADAEPGDDWILPFMEEDATETDRERMYVRLIPQMLHELYIETRDLLSDTRQAGHTAEYDFRGESVPLRKTVPDRRKGPVRKRCYVDACGEPVWVEDHWAGSNQRSDVPIGRCWLRA